MCPCLRRKENGHCEFQVSAYSFEVQSSTGVTVVEQETPRVGVLFTSNPLLMFLVDVLGVEASQN